jgi:hypothetical protein
MAGHRRTTWLRHRDWFHRTVGLCGQRQPSRFGHLRQPNSPRIAPSAGEVAVVPPSQIFHELMKRFVLTMAAARRRPVPTCQPGQGAD